MYFTKKLSYRYANYLSLAERNMTILNTKKIFFIRATNVLSNVTREEDQGRSLCVQLVSALSDQRILLHILQNKTFWRKREGGAGGSPPPPPLCRRHCTCYHCFFCPLMAKKCVCYQFVPFAVCVRVRTCSTFCANFG